MGGLGWTLDEMLDPFPHRGVARPASQFISQAGFFLCCAQPSLSAGVSPHKSSATMQGHVSAVTLRTARRHLHGETTELSIQWSLSNEKMLKLMFHILQSTGHVVTVHIINMCNYLFTSELAIIHSSLITCVILLNCVLAVQALTVLIHPY